MKRTSHSPGKQSIPTVRDDQTAANVLAMMDRWDERLQGHNSEKREGGRIKYRTKLLLKVPVVVATDSGTSHVDSQLEVWSRNISRSGVGFLSHNKILADNIVLCLNPNSAEQKWYHGVIVRRRPVQSEFWDYGVQLTGPASNK